MSGAAIEILDYPWRTPRRLDDAAVEAHGRPCLVTSAKVESVRMIGAIEGLPRIGERTTNGRQHVLWALPAPNEASEHLQLVLRGAGRDEAVNIHLRETISRPQAESTEADEQESADEIIVTPDEMLGTAVEQLVGAHAEMISELCDWGSIKDAWHWDGAVQGAMLRGQDAVLKHWQAIGGTEEPRYALIVRLAQDLGRLLPEVCRQPRVVLQRDRQLRHVARVEQVDATCLRWVARQPGRTIAEKAGSDQRVMSVVRLERADTPENRVVKDLVRRCIQACRDYEREHRHFGNHDRIDLVRRFRLSLQPLLRHGPMTEVQSLTGPARPNYVLQFDKRYAPLWAAYQQLLRQQRLRDSAWRWRHRLWSESARLLLLTALETLPKAQRQYRSDLQLTDEHRQGLFLDPAAELAPVLLRDGSEIIPVAGLTHSTAQALHMERVYQLAPDMILLRRDEQMRSVELMVCWALCVSRLVDTSIATDLACHLAQVEGETPIRGLLVIATPESEPAAFSTEIANVSLVHVPFPPQRGVTRVAHALQQMWKIDS